MFDHARQFLALALPTPVPGHAYLNIHWSNVGDDGKKYWDGRACETVDEAISVIGWVHRMGGRDLYACMSTQARLEHKTSKKGNQYKRAIRSQQDVREIKSFYADIDVKSDADVEGKRSYACQKDALDAVLAFIKAVGLPLPSTVVCSGFDAAPISEEDTRPRGGGFHMHWVLEEAIGRDQWQPLADALSAALQTHNIYCDTQCTVDSARILRIPETSNYKTSKVRPVQLMSLSHPVTLEVMQAALAPFIGKRPSPAPKTGSPFEVDNPAPAQSAAPTINDDLGAGVGKAQITLPITEVALACPFVARTVATGGKDNANPLWFLTSSLATFIEDGRAAFHLMSNQHPGYDPKATDLLYDRTVATKQRKDLGWPQCSKFASYGAPECQTCPLFQHGKSPLNFVVNPGVAKNTEPDVTLPERYVRDADGFILARTINEDGTQSLLPVMPYPVYSGWLSNDPVWTFHMTTRTENGRKATINIPCEVITGSKDTFNRAMGARGMFLQDLQFKVLKEFLVSWLQKLQEAKDSVISAAPYGWSVVDGKIEGFAYGGRVWLKDSDRPAANPSPVLAYQYTPKGDPSIWAQSARVIYEQDRPALNAILAVAFAGPLVRFTGHPGLILNAYSPESGIGKTTAMKVSQAVWGHPVLAMQALNDTANSVLGKMGQTRSLPVYWDEIKSDQQVRQFCSIVFTMTGGREKTRMTQDAQLRMSGQWQTMLVSASNESLVDGMAREVGSTTAGLHRMFEYTVPPGNSLPTDVGTVQRLIGKLEENYGHAGMEYARWLGQNAARAEAEVAAIHDELLREVELKQEERIWVSTVAVLLKGAEYGNELGLTNINVPDLRRFLVEVFMKNRAEVAGSPTDLTNDESAITVLGELLNATRTRYTLQTNRIWMSQGKPAKGAIKIIGDASKLQEFRIQIGMEDRVIRIASTFLTGWLGERGYSRVTWVKKMEREFGMRRVVGILGGGTDLVGAKEQLVELDMNHPKLAQFLE